MQPINLILCFISVSILKIVFKRGHKSHALRLFGLSLCFMVSIGMIAFITNSSTEQTNKISFKAAGVKYKEHFTVPKTFSQDVPIEQKQRKNTSSSTSRGTSECVPFSSVYHFQLYTIFKNKGTRSEMVYT